MMHADSQRQQVLFLWLDDSSLHARVRAWSYHDGSAPGTDLEIDDGGVPYATGEAALADGWRLIQVSPLETAAPGDEHRIGHLRHEFVFERIVDTPEGADNAAELS